MDRKSTWGITFTRLLSARRAFLCASRRHRNPQACRIANWKLAPHSRLTKPACTDQHAPMNKQLRLLLVPIAFLLLNACATSPMGKSTSLAGTWTNTYGTVWTINSDG